MSYEKQTWKEYNDELTEEQNIQIGAVVTAERMNHLETGLEEHDKNKSNPHQVTKEQIGLVNVSNVEQASKIDLNSHKNDKTNPHNVTKAQVGLSNVANVEQASKTDFLKHTSNKTNPHGVTKNQIDLGNVDNYMTATVQEAEAGLATNKFMTPERVTQQIFTGFGQSFRDAPLYIAHRGNNYFYPENSILAFRTITRHWGIETDIQLTTDGKWYCFHDSTVDRMTNGTGKFMDKTSAQIEALRLDAGNGIAGLPDAFKKIPTFDQYLDECMKARKVPVIEITPLKTDFTSAQLDSIAATIRNKGLENKVVIICFTLDVLKQMRTRMPYTVMHYLVENDSSDIYNACLDYNLVPSFSNTGNSLTAAVVNKYHAVNREVGMWVTQSTTDHDRMKSLGFDYILVDQPGGNLRYEEPALLSGFTQNDATQSGVTFVEEYAPGVIHIRVNVRDGSNTVGANIFKLPEWAIPRWSNTLVGQVRSTKMASHTFVPASVDVWGYAALSDSNNSKSFGYLTVGTNWEQRATYATIDLVYNI